MPHPLFIMQFQAQESEQKLLPSYTYSNEDGSTCLGVGDLKMKAQSYLETTCYVLMGLTILIAFKPFYDTCGLAIVLWVVGEGVAYITGAVLYSFKKVPYIHSVFHVFVILGDVCHMIATWKVVQMFILG